LAAALAYYTVFSIAPLLIIVIAIAGSVFGEEARGEIVGQGLVGRDGAEVIRRLKMPTSQLWGLSPLLSALSSSLGASGVRSFKMLSTPFGR